MQINTLMRWKSY